MRRRLGERLRIGGGISGNGEQEQGHAHGGGDGGDVREEMTSRSSHLVAIG
jgi:hypothetical protein